MASESKSAGTMADDSAVGTIAWTQVDDAKISDNLYANASFGTSNEISHYLKATNFGFAIPAGSVINGIIVSIERKQITGPAAPDLLDNIVSMVKAGVISGDDKAQSVDWDASDTVVTYGGAADLWGLTWTVANINASNFGAVISAKTGPGGLGAPGGQIDQLGQIEVFYTAGADMEDQAGNTQII